MRRHKRCRNLTNIRPPKSRSRRRRSNLRVVRVSWHFFWDFECSTEPGVCLWDWDVGDAVDTGYLVIHRRREKQYRWEVQGLALQKLGRGIKPARTCADTTREEAPVQPTIRQRHPRPRRQAKGVSRRSHLPSIVLRIFLSHTLPAPRRFNDDPQIKHSSIRYIMIDTKHLNSLSLLSDHIPPLHLSLLCACEETG